MISKNSSIVKFLFIAIIVLLYWFGSNNLSEDGESKDPEDRIKDIEKEIDKLKKYLLLIIPIIRTLFFK